MKKFYAFLWVIIIPQFLFAQNHRDDIALIVNSICFGCDVEAQTQETMKSAYYAFFTTELEKNALFKVVNRDITDESIISLGKYFDDKDPGFLYWVNYTEKLREQSKGIGANYLVLIDIFNYTDKVTREGEIYFRFKIIKTESNKMVTFTIKRDQVFKSEKQFREFVSEMMNSVSYEMLDNIDEVWNTSFFIKSAEGNNLIIQPYSVFPLNEFQKINWHEWKQHDIGGQTFFEVLDFGGCKITGWENGSIFIRTQMDFSKHDLQKIWGTLKPNYLLSNSGSFPISFVELPFNEMKDGMINFKINTLIYDAIKATTQYSLVQISSKDLVYAEKEKQKGEEFIDGKTIEQNNSSKCDYILTAKDLGSNLEMYKVKLDFISVSTGEILKTTIIETSPTKFSKELSNWLHGLIMPPCRVEIVGSEVNVFTIVTTTLTNDFKYQIIEMRKVEMGDKIENIRVPLATLNLKKKYGQKIVFEIEEILEEDFVRINKANTYYLSVMQ